MAKINESYEAMVIFSSKLDEEAVTHSQLSSMT